MVGPLLLQTKENETIAEALHSVNVGAAFHSILVEGLCGHLIAEISIMNPLEISSVSSEITGTYTWFGHTLVNRF